MPDWNSPEVIAKAGRASAVFTLYSELDVLTVCSCSRLLPDDVYIPRDTHLGTIHHL